MPFICTTIHMVHPVLCICALGTYNRRLQRQLTTIFFLKNAFLKNYLISCIIISICIPTAIQIFFFDQRNLKLTNFYFILFSSDAAFTTPKTVHPHPKNFHDRVTNIEALVKNLKSYYEVSLGHNRLDHYSQSCKI